MLVQKGRGKKLCTYHQMGLRRQEGAPFDAKYGARMGVLLSNTINLMLRLFLYHFLHTMTLTDESRVVRPHKKHKQPYKHPITMVAEPLAPPAVWI
jgi:hypothetical protein